MPKMPDAHRPSNRPAKGEDDSHDESSKPIATAPSVQGLSDSESALAFAATNFRESAFLKMILATIMQQNIANISILFNY